MKKTLNLIGIICLAAIIGLAMAACENPAQSITYVDPVVDIGSKTLVDIDIFQRPVKILYDLNDPNDAELDRTGMVVVAIYDDGYFAPITDYDVSGFPLGTTAGVKTVTITYEGKTTTFTINAFSGSKTKLSPPTYVLNGNQITVSLPADAPAGAQIWYTDNGLTPTANGNRTTRYQNPFNLTPGLAYKFVTTHPDYYDSDIVDVSL